MRKLVSVAVFLLAVTVVHFAADVASAQGPCGYWGDGFYYGFYRRNLQTDQIPPYFSQFPPVYYRMPIIARPYGWSPFALRPGELDVIPPVVIEPVTIRNPYVEQAPVKAEKSDDKTAAAPRVILNPFVQPGLDIRIASRADQR